MKFSLNASEQTMLLASKWFKLIPTFVCPRLQQALISECALGLRKATWSQDHFDTVIVDFRERVVNNLADFPTIKKLFDNIIKPKFFPDTVCLQPHIIELSSKGYIRPHVDNYCGPTIVGISLGASRTMRLRQVIHPDDYFEIELAPGSLYWQSEAMRYDYEHEILPTDPMLPQNRVSIIFREIENLHQFP